MSELTLLVTVDRIPPADLAVVDAVAKDRGVSREVVIREAVSNFAAHCVPTQKNKARKSR